MPETIVPANQELEAESVGLVNSALAVVVSDSNSYAQAAEIGKRLARVDGAFLSWFEPFKKSAYDHWKTLCAGENNFRQRITGALAYLRRVMGTWEAAERDRAAAETARLQAAMKKQEDDSRVAQASALEKMGAKDLAERTLEAPLFMPRVEVEPSVPKIKGVSGREIWSAEVVDFKALILAVAADIAKPEAERRGMIAFLEPNQTLLNSHARNLKAEFKIPGVQARREASTSFSKG
jgi:hypothetical protein